MFTTAEDLSTSKPVLANFSGFQAPHPTLDEQLGQARKDFNRAFGQLVSIPCDQLPSIFSQPLIFSHTMQNLFKEAGNVSTIENLGVAAMTYQAAGKIVEGMRWSVSILWL